MRERERGVGRRGDVQGVTEQAGRQEVAGRVAAAGVARARSCLGEGEEDDRGGGQVGWAGQLGRPGRTGTGCTWR